MQLLYLQCVLWRRISFLLVQSDTFLRPMASLRWHKILSITTCIFNTSFIKIFFSIVFCFHHRTAVTESGPSGVLQYDAWHYCWVLQIKLAQFAFSALWYGLTYLLTYSSQCCVFDDVHYRIISKLRCLVLATTSLRTGCRWTLSLEWFTSDLWSKRTREHIGVMFSVKREKTPWLDICECSVIYHIISYLSCKQELKDRLITCMLTLIPWLWYIWPLY